MGILRFNDGASFVNGTGTVSAINVERGRAVVAMNQSKIPVKVEFFSTNSIGDYPTDPIYLDPGAAFSYFENAGTGTGTTRDISATITARHTTVNINEQFQSIVNYDPGFESSATNGPQFILTSSEDA